SRLTQTRQRPKPRQRQQRGLPEPPHLRTRFRGARASEAQCGLPAGLGLGRVRKIPLAFVSSKVYNPRTKSAERGAAMPPVYLDKLKVERAERLARMKIPRDSAAAARVPFSAQDPEWIHSLWWEEIATIKSRLKALEQRLEVLADCARPATPRAQ